MKKLLMIVALMVIPVWGFAEWVEFGELVIPQGYEKAWAEKDIYDAYGDLFYRMMQTGRGVAKGEKVFFYGETIGKPIELEDGRWLIFLDYETYSHDVGLILSEMPKELLDSDSRIRCWVFARYEGVTVPKDPPGTLLPLPVLVCDRIAMLKTILDVRTFNSALGPLRSSVLEDLKLVPDMLTGGYYLAP